MQIICNYKGQGKRQQAVLLPIGGNTVGIIFWEHRRSPPQQK